MLSQVRSECESCLLTYCASECLYKVWPLHTQRWQIWVLPFVIAFQAISALSLLEALDTGVLWHCASGQFLLPCCMLWWTHLLQMLPVYISSTLLLRSSSKTQHV